MMMKLLVKTVKEPTISLEPNNVTVQASGTVTAYAIQPNTTLSPLFVLNMVSQSLCQSLSQEEVECRRSNCQSDT